MYQKKSAFTLVELLVVVTILSILGTIGFISLGGYAVLARESARIADINTITKSLNIYYTTNDRYPDTANGVGVSYSGSALWTQGYFTDEVRSKLGNISQSPLDPVIGSPYIYSVTYNNQEFQLAGASERGSPLGMDTTIPETYASFSKAMIKGNYNGAILAKNINESIYIFGVPSIVTHAISASDIQDIYQNRSFVVNGFGALPPGFITDGETAPNLEFPSSATVVDQNTALLYQGTKEALSSHNTMLSLSQNMYNLYSTTPLMASEKIQKLFSTNPSTYTTMEEQLPLTVQTAQYLLSAGSTAPVLETPSLISLSQNTNQTGIGAGNEASPPAPTDPACYNAANLGTIGQVGWTGCAGMLIVSTAQLLEAGSSNNGGNDSFAILGPDTHTYTFASGPYKIFTGQVTDMSHLFQFTSFNGDIGYWDTSNVTTMLRMFEFAQSFNQDISSWNTSNVTNMSHTFHWAQNFNQPLNSWDVSNVTDMSILFNYAQSFNQPLDSWDVSNVTNMQFLFRGTSFNQPLNSWNVAQVSNMREIFSGNNAFNQPLNSWDVGNAINMNGVFNEARSFDQDISSWNVDSVVDMTYMFTEANVFNQDLSSWCVTNIGSFPTEFDTNTTAWVKSARQPIWGTCP